MGTHMGKRKLGIGTWAYMFGPYASHPVDFATVCETIHEMGFDAVSISGFAPHIFVDDYDNDEKIKELLTLLEKNALSVAEFSPDPCGINPVLEPEPYIERMKRNILFLEKCGFPLLRLDTACPPVLPEGVSYELAYERTVYTFRQLAAFAAEHNVKLVWEFEPGFLFNKPSEVCAVVKDVDHSNFTILFDACHAYMCAVVGARQLGEHETLEGGVIEFMHMLKGHIGMVHLIDSDGTLHDDDTSTHAPFGTGCIDMDEVYAELCKPDVYDGEFVSIDLCFWADAWNVTQNCYDYVRALMDRHEKKEAAL